MLPENAAWAGSKLAKGFFPTLDRGDDPFDIVRRNSAAGHDDDAIPSATDNFCEER
jgi:hypothetical protein